MGALADIHKARHVIRMALRLAESVVVYTNGNEKLAAELRGGIGGLNAVVDTRRIARLEKMDVGAQVKVHFEDGDENGDNSKVEGFLVCCFFCSLIFLFIWCYMGTNAYRSTPQQVKSMDPSRSSWDWK